MNSGWPIQRFSDPWRSTRSTIAMWVKWDGALSHNQTLIAKRDTWVSSQMRWQLVRTTANVLQLLRAGSQILADDGDGQA